MDIVTGELMPTIEPEQWPEPRALCEAQRHTGITTDYKETIRDHEPYTDAANQIVLPIGDPLTTQVVALYH